MASDRQRQSSKQNRRKSQAAVASFPTSASLSVPKPSATSVARPEGGSRFTSESLPSSSGKCTIPGLDRLGSISDLLDSATAESAMVSSKAAADWQTLWSRCWRWGSSCCWDPVNRVSARRSCCFLRSIYGAAQNAHEAYNFDAAPGPVRRSP